MSEVNDEGTLLAPSWWKRLSKRNRITILAVGWAVALAVLFAAFNIDVGGGQSVAQTPSYQPTRAVGQCSASSAPRLPVLLKPRLRISTKHRIA